MSDIIIGVALWHLSPRFLAGCIGSGHRSGHSEREIMGRLTGWGGGRRGAQAGPGSNLCRLESHYQPAVISQQLQLINQDYHQTVNSVL